MMRHLILIALAFSSWFCVSKPIENNPSRNITIDTLNDKQIIELFSYMHKEDVSNVRKPFIRYHVFVSNMNQIISLIKRQGFPVLKEKPKRRKNQAIIARTTVLTFTHILQTSPELLLNEETIAIIKLELESKRMPKELIDIPLSQVFGFDKIAEGFSAETRKMYDLAVQEWQVTLIPPGEKVSVE